MELIILVPLTIALVILARLLADKPEQSEKPAKQPDWVGAFKAFAWAYKQVLQNPVPALIVVVAYLALLVVERNVLGPEPQTLEWSYYGKLAAFEFGFVLVFLQALPTYGLALAKGKKISVADFLRVKPRKYLALLVATILYFLASLASILLFIIPAIWVIAWFSLLQFAVLDKNMGPVQSLKESKRLIGDHKGKVWGIIGALMLFTIGATIVSAIPSIGQGLSYVLSMFISVLCTAALASLYTWAKRQTVA